MRGRGLGRKERKGRLPVLAQVARGARRDDGGLPVELGTKHSLVRGEHDLLAGPQLARPVAARTAQPEQGDVCDLMWGGRSVS